MRIGSMARYRHIGGFLLAGENLRYSHCIHQTQGRMIFQKIVWYLSVMLGGRLQYIDYKIYISELTYDDNYSQMHAVDYWLQ